MFYNFKKIYPTHTTKLSLEVQETGTTVVSGSVCTVLGVNDDELPEAILPPVDYDMDSIHGESVKRAFDLDSEIVYAPPSHVSMDGGDNYGRFMKSRRLPSEYSAMSIASHVRKVQIPSKNSDVDKFLDDLFDPVSLCSFYDKQNVSCKNSYTIPSCIIP